MRQQRFVTLSKNASNPAYVGARLGVSRLAAQLGVTVENFSPVVDDSIEEQVAFLEQLLSAPPAAVIVSPAHESALDNALQALRQAGVPIVMFVGQTTRKDLADCFIGSDNHAMTQAVATEIAHALHGKGGVMTIDGNPLGILYQARARGFRDGIAAFDGIELLGERDGLFLRAPAHAAMHALIDAHGLPDAVLVANDFMALGVIDALRERGARALIGSVNATPDGVEAIRRGEMHATAAFNAMAMGCLALHAARRICAGETVPQQILLPAEVVTAQNLDAWSLPYDQRALPDWDRAVQAQRSLA